MSNAAERQRRRRWLDVHMRYENQHDLEGIVSTFDPSAVMVFNGMPFESPDAIGAGHTLFGFSKDPGGLSSLEIEAERIYFTHDEIVVEGLARGIHTADLLGLDPTGLQVAMPYLAFYRFNADGKLVSERVTMDWAQLNPVTQP